MTSIVKSNIPLCVNWHITEKCNYKCKGCFAKWNKQNEVWNDCGKVKFIIQNINDYIEKSKTFPKNWRLNIVGGEPILEPKKLEKVIEFTKECGVDVSLITNGSHIENIYSFAHLISKIGVSLDSFNHETNLKIGRECCGKTISFDDIKEKIEILRSLNQNLEIKVNTVVNPFNFSEVLSDKIYNLNIKKWKIFRQMPFGESKGISDFEFYSFLHNNYEVFEFNDRQKIFIEENDIMTESYLMISPDGSLFQNGSLNYNYTKPLTEISFAEALNEITFKEAKFNDRYNLDKTNDCINHMKRFFENRLHIASF